MFEVLRKEDKKLYDDLRSAVDRAAVAEVPKVVTGGIDLNISNGMQWKVSRDGRGVEMNVDPAMIAAYPA